MIDEALLRQLLNGLTVGSVYSILAMSLSLVLGVSHIPNLALGHKAVLGAYLTLAGITLLGLPFWVAIALSVVVVGALGSATYLLGFKRLTGSPITHGFIAAAGVLFILEAGMLAIWGPGHRRVPLPGYLDTVIDVAGMGVRVQRLVVIAGAVVLMLLLDWYTRRVKQGLSLRAVAESRPGAELVGIEPQRADHLSMVIGSAVAAVSGGLVAPLANISPTVGRELVIPAVVAMVLGGMGNVRGAMLAGILLGLGESLGTHFISADYQAMYAFIVLLAVLVLRPTGLFGPKGRVAGRAA